MGSICLRYKSDLSVLPLEVELVPLGDTFFDRDSQIFGSNNLTLIKEVVYYEL